MGTFWNNENVKLYLADARELPLADKSVHAAITSPPYWMQRDYSLGAKGIGMEATPAEYIANLRQVFREVYRVLRDDGLLWLNLGDSRYGGRGPNSKPVYSLGIRARWNQPGWSNKSTLSQLDLPQRVVEILVKDGWLKRQEIIWRKTQCTPESVYGMHWQRHQKKIQANTTHAKDGLGALPSGDLSASNKATWEDCPGCKRCSSNDGLILCKGSWRPTTDYERIYLLAKRGGYYADKQAVAVPVVDSSRYDKRRQLEKNSRPDNNFVSAHKSMGGTYLGTALTRNLRSVWDLANQNSKDEHHADFPEKLVEICILASTSQKGVCPKCGKPWARIIEKLVQGSWNEHTENLTRGSRQTSGGPNWDTYEPARTVGWRATCKCKAQEPAPAVILDPFVGSGTVCVMAQKLGRHSVAGKLKVGGKSDASG